MGKNHTRHSRGSGQAAMPNNMATRDFSIFGGSVTEVKRHGNEKIHAPASEQHVLGPHQCDKVVFLSIKRTGSNKKEGERESTTIKPLLQKMEIAATWRKKDGAINEREELRGVRKRERERERERNDRIPCT